MGISITSKNYSTDIPTSGFMNFRKKVAELTNSEIFEHYEKLIYNSSLCTEKDFEEYDKKTKKITKKYSQYKPIIKFLYLPDVEGKASKKQCKKIWDIIKDYDDDKLYGYVGWNEDAVKFSDFKKIIKDGAENRGFKWY